MDNIGAHGIESIYGQESVINETIRSVYFKTILQSYPKRSNDWKDLRES